MDKLPSGSVTFLFTDIEDSTRLWQEQPEAMSHAHALHDKILAEGKSMTMEQAIQLPVKA